jgi:hypothetical protein
LKTIDAGYPIAYIGFPMEDLEGKNINIQMPIATFKSGIVSAITDYFLAKSGFGKNFLIRHDMGSAGGASGSPVVNTRGEVVAIHNASNIYHVLGVDKEGKPIIKKIKHAAMINYAQRVDLLNVILP